MPSFAWMLPLLPYEIKRIEIYITNAQISFFCQMIITQLQSQLFKQNHPDRVLTMEKDAVSETSIFLIAWRSSNSYRILFKCHINLRDLRTRT
jgi:hypothetical protein